MFEDINKFQRFTREATETIVNVGNRVSTLESAVKGLRPMALLAESVSPGGVNGITFSDIPADYHFLRLFLSIRSDRAVTDEEIYLRFNTDSGNNYNYVYQQFNSAGAAHGGGISQSALYLGHVPAATAPASTFGILDILVGGYSTTNMFSHVRAQCTKDIGGAAGNLYHYSSAGWWKDTDVATSLTVLLNTGNIAEYSELQLFGVP